jgi:hypothetical protein
MKQTASVTFRDCAEEKQLEGEASAGDEADAGSLCEGSRGIRELGEA